MLGELASSMMASMPADVFAQAAGWIASVVTMSSYALRGVRPVRIANLVGAVFFIIYGVLIGSVAIVIGNAAISLVQLSRIASKGRAACSDAYGARASRRKAWLIFALYAIAMIIWAVLSVAAGEMATTEILGIIAAVGLAGAFLVEDEMAMRASCAVFTMAWIAYAILIGSAPVAITNAVALVANGVRMVQVKAGSEKEINEA